MITEQTFECHTTEFSFFCAEFCNAFEIIEFVVQPRKWIYSIFIILKKRQSFLPNAAHLLHSYLFKFIKLFIHIIFFMYFYFSLNSQNYAAESKIFCLGKMRTLMIISLVVGCPSNGTIHGGSRFKQRDLDQGRIQSGGRIMASAGAQAYMGVWGLAPSGVQGQSPWSGGQGSWRIFVILSLNF